MAEVTSQMLVDTVSMVGVLGASMLVTLAILWTLFIVTEAASQAWQGWREERRRAARQAADLQRRMNDSITSMQVAFWQARERLRDEADRSRE